MRTYEEQHLRWKDSTGRVWIVAEMSTHHIKNSMRMLFRQAERLHDERTVDGFRRAIEGSGMIARGEQAQADEIEYMFYHLRMKPKEWVRSLDIMKAFHHELQRRRRRMHELKEEGRATFEFPQ